jgi:putative zinc finger/helix-turn-helix YgiT family protein
LAGIPSSRSTKEEIDMNNPSCPKGHGPMEHRNITKQKTFKGVDIDYTAEAFVCLECGLEAGTVESAANVQRKMADAYRAKVGRLTGQGIRSLRKGRNITQQQLADATGVGIASIKRWETGTVQSVSMDNILRVHLEGKADGDQVTGGREISLPRIKLVSEAFENILEKRLLKSGDKFLFLGKYLWYADFLAFRQLGKSLTGASYAALPYGPQLNNYKDLVESIKAADITNAEPLSEMELLVIHKVCHKFPNEKEVYDAAHRERIWQKSPIGALISYSGAHEFTEI